MHILLIHQAFVSISEAGGTRHHELAIHLTQRGHRVTIIASPVSYLTGKRNDTSEKARSISEDGRLTILRTYTYSALHRSFVHRVLSFFSFMVSSFWAGLHVKDVDLVWGTSPPIFQGATAWVLARLKRVPFLFEVRDLWPAFAIQVGVLKNPILIRMSLWLEQLLYKKADKLIINSPGFLEHVRERGGRNIQVVPNGVDPAMFEPDSSGETYRLENGLEDRFIAMYAGAHGMSNDLNSLLDAAQLLKGRLDIALALVGDGKEKPDLQLRARAMGLENIYFHHPIPKMQMSQAIAAADACIAILKPIPLYATVYPNKVFDYMAAGRAVILAIDGVIREVVEQAGCGVFAQPGDPKALADAIRRLADDPEQTRLMGLRGRKFVEENFDRGKLADMLVEIIEKMD
jgi:glycosyltransferase involved in cell wall biosynthesis